jgi:glycosyltransferase involved in cell wall biosynthesis
VTPAAAPFGPLVSVIVPCYNHARYVGEAVESALAQTYVRREVILVDDGSEDETQAVAAAFGTAIRVVRRPNGGLAAARNTGIAHARGSIIGLLDADDRWLPRKLETEVPAFADPRVGVVHGSYRKFPARHRAAGEVHKRQGEVSTVHDLLELNRVGAPVSALFRRTVFNRVGRFDESLCGAEDWDLWLRMSVVSRVVGSAAVTSEYRLQDTSMSRQYERMYDALNRVVEKNRFHHRACIQCEAAARKAHRNAASYYYDFSARAAFEARRAGDFLTYASLRIRGLARHPVVLRRIVPAIVRRARAAIL